MGVGCYFNGKFLILQEKKEEMIVFFCKMFCIFAIQKGEENNRSQTNY